MIPIPRPRHRWRLVGLAIGAPVLAVALYYAKWDYLDHRFVTITPGQVYQSAAMPAATMVQTMQDHGIRTVIDLRDEDEDLVAAEAASVAKANRRHLRVPMSVEPRQEDVRAFLAAMATAERPVLVHCEHGEGRSVLMCALYRIEVEGWSNEAAFDGTARLPPGLHALHCLIPPLFRFRKDSPKGAMVLDYRPSQATQPAAANDVANGR